MSSCFNHARTSTNFPVINRSTGRLLQARSRFSSGPLAYSAPVPLCHRDVVNRERFDHIHMEKPGRWSRFRRSWWAIGTDCSATIASPLRPNTDASGPPRRFQKHDVSCGSSGRNQWQLDPKDRLCTGFQRKISRRRINDAWPVAVAWLASPDLGAKAGLVRETANQTFNR